MHWHGNVNHHVVKHTHSVFLSYNLNCLNSIRCASTSTETFNSSSVSSSTVELPFPEHLRPTPYEIFHLRPGASPNAIKSRYYQLVRIHHPDAPYARTLPTDISHARFQAIQAAYDVLTGKMRRRDFPSPMYDASPMVHKTNRSYDHMHHRSHFTHAEWAHSSFESGAASKEDDNSRVFALIMTGVVGLLGLPFLTTSVMSEKRHKTAAQNLSQARREAREVGQARRAEIRRRVRENELDQEYSERVARESFSNTIPR